MKDITGQKFGMLTAICPTNRRQHGSVIWEFQCDCGWTTHKSLRNLRFTVNADKYPPSCGCIHKNYDTYRQMIGKKYGRLLIVDVIYNESKKQYYFVCLCDCGKTKHISPYTLLVGGQKSCSRNCSMFRPTLPSGVGHARQIYAIKKYSVLRQHMNFDLTFEEFYKLSTSNCSICGMYPNVHWDSGDSRGHNGVFIHNKIAYADPEVGFVMGNVFSVCLEHSYEIRGLHHRGIIPINYGEELCLKNG